MTPGRINGAGGLVEQKLKFSVRFEAKPGGHKPVRHALTAAKQFVEVFLGRFPACCPPLVVNITDGESTDGDPLPSAKALCDLKSADGNVLLFNAHISDSPANPVEFPASEGGLPDNFAARLFSMSSQLPPRLLEAARGDGFAARDGARGFVFNADLVSVIRFLDIGTRAAQGVR